MISITIAQSIFQQTEEGAKLAGTYAMEGQNAIALDWVGRQNFRIGQYLCYMWVVSDSADTCLAFNDYVAEYIVNNFDVYARSYQDDDWLDRECICDLRQMLESDPYSESWLVDKMRDYILEHDLIDDAVHLVDISLI